MWKIFNETKPTQEGWYLCTVEVKNFQRYTMNLYWYPNTKTFIDNIRQDVCEVYTVTGLEGKRLYDIGQNRTEDVVAWRELPEPYMEGFVKEWFA